MGMKTKSQEIHGRGFDTDIKQKLKLTVRRPVDIIWTNPFQRRKRGFFIVRNNEGVKQMKIAICNELFQGWPIERVFEYAAQLGYEGVASRSIGYLKGILESLAETG